MLHEQRVGEGCMVSVESELEILEREGELGTANQSIEAKLELTIRERRVSVEEERAVNPPQALRAQLLCDSLEYTHFVGVFTEVFRNPPSSQVRLFLCS